MTGSSDARRAQEVMGSCPRSAVLPHSRSCVVPTRHAFWLHEVMIGTVASSTGPDCDLGSASRFEHGRSSTSRAASAPPERSPPSRGALFADDADDQVREDAVGDTQPSGDFAGDIEDEQRVGLEVATVEAVEILGAQHEQP